MSAPYSKKKLKYKSQYTRKLRARLIGNKLSHELAIVG